MPLLIYPKVHIIMHASNQSVDMAKTARRNNSKKILCTAAHYYLGNRVQAWANNGPLVSHPLVTHKY
jgi:hypothetical protein